MSETEKARVCFRMQCEHDTHCVKVTCSSCVYSVDLAKFEFYVAGYIDAAKTTIEAAIQGGLIPND